MFEDVLVLRFQRAENRVDKMHAKRRTLAQTSIPSSPSTRRGLPRVAVKADLCDKQSLIWVQHVCWVHPVSPTRITVSAQGPSQHTEVQNELPEGPWY